MSSLDCSICNNAAAKRASRRLGQFYDDVLAGTNIRATQYALLEKVRLLGSPSMTDIALALVLDRSALSHTLRPLERDGLVELHGAQHDRRIKRVVVTTKGMQKIEECAKLWRVAQDQFERVFGVDEAASLRITLDQISSLSLCPSKALQNITGRQREPT